MRVLGCLELGDVGIIFPTLRIFKKSPFPSLLSVCSQQATLGQLRVPHMPSAPRKADLCSVPEARRCHQLLPMSHLLTNQSPVQGPPTSEEDWK